MADTTIQSGFDIINRNKSYNTTTDFDPTVNRWGEKEKYDELTRDRSTLSFTDMLGLMVTQFQNQTIDNQASTTDMMNQLVQMTTMQAMTDMTTNIKELTLANVMAYSASLVGKTVTIGVYNEETKETEEIVGVVQGTGTYDGQQVIYLDNGKGYFLNEIMAVGTLPPKPEKPEEPGEGEDGDKTEGTDTDNDTDTDNSTDTDNDTNTDGSGSDDGGAVS